MTPRGPTRGGSLPLPCPGGGAEGWKARLWGRAERGRAEERAEGERGLPEELIVEVSVVGGSSGTSRVTHSGLLIVFGSPVSHLYAPGEAPVAAFVTMAWKEGPKKNDDSRKTTGTASLK